MKTYRSIADQSQVFRRLLSKDTCIPLAHLIIYRYSLTQDTSSRLLPALLVITEVRTQDSGGPRDSTRIFRWASRWALVEDVGAVGPAGASGLF